MLIYMFIYIIYVKLGKSAHQLTPKEKILFVKRQRMFNEKIFIVHVQKLC